MPQAFELCDFLYSCNVSESTWGPKARKKVEGCCIAHSLAKDIFIFWTVKAANAPFEPWRDPKGANQLIWSRMKWLLIFTGLTLFRLATFPNNLHCTHSPVQFNCFREAPWMRATRNWHTWQPAYQCLLASRIFCAFPISHTSLRACLPAIASCWRRSKMLQASWKVEGYSTEGESVTSFRGAGNLWHTPLNRRDFSWNFPQISRNFLKFPEISENILKFTQIFLKFPKISELFPQFSLKLPEIFLKFHKVSQNFPQISWNFP